MASLRVTQGILVLRTMNNLDSHMRKLLELQDQLSTGHRINNPSDDPIDVRRAIDARASIGKFSQYMDNMTSIGPQLSETASSIMTTVDLLQRTQELTLRAGSATNAPAQLEQIAEEINQLLEATLVEGNHLTNGRYIFAGTRTSNPAYTPARDVSGNITAVTYNGNDEVINAAISDGVEITINEPGDGIFQSNEDIFQVLIDIRDNMLSADYTSLGGPRLIEIDNLREQLLSGVARVGAVQNRVERTVANTDDFIVQLERVQSDSIDADFAEVTIALNAASNAFQAGLNAAARVIQPSLLDFIS